MPNPLISDQLVDFILSEVVDIDGLCQLPAFAEHSRATIGSTRIAEWRESISSRPGAR